MNNYYSDASEIVEAEIEIACSSGEEHLANYRNKFKRKF